MSDHQLDPQPEPQADHPLGESWQAPARTFGVRTAVLAGLVAALGVGSGAVAAELTGVFADSPGASALAAFTTNNSCSGTQ